MDLYKLKPKISGLNEKPLQSVIFPPAFFAESSKFTAHLHNHSTKTLDFSVRIIRHCGASREPLTNLTVSPKSGRLFTQENILLKFACRASITSKEKGFISQQQAIGPVTTSGYIEIAYGRLDGSTTCDTRLLKIPFSVTFEALSVALQAEPALLDSTCLKTLNFGCCTIHTCIKKHLLIRNNSKCLSIQFEFAKIAHFHFEPFKGTVKPDNLKIISIVFAPNQLGLLSRRIKLAIFGRSSNVHQTILLRVVGNATTSSESVNQESTDNFVEIERFCGDGNNHECARTDHKDSKITHPQLLDFGILCLNTSLSKRLKIENHQNEKVFVELHSSDYQVAIKGDTSHVISPHASHDFEVSVSPRSPGVFRSLLSLQVDGAPFNCIEVEAQAELPYLAIYPNEISMNPLSRPTCLVSVDGVREFVRLMNHLNEPVHFRWTSNCEWEGLKIYPESGIVPAIACQNCEISYQYSFKEGTAAEKKVTFSLSAFLRSPLNLEGVVTHVNVLLDFAPPKLTSTSKRIKLGDVPYGLEITRVFRLRNAGGGPAFVELHTLSVVNGVNITVDPCRVEIRSQEDAVFKVTCHSRRMGYFEIPISIHHASKEVMRIIAQGICIFPKVEVIPSRMRIRCKYRGKEVLGTPIGETSKDSFTVKNVSPVPARIEFEFNDCKDFSVENETQDPLKPFSSKNYELIFKPEKVSNFDFMLPLIVNGKRVKLDACRITTTSVRALVNISPRVIFVQFSPSIRKSTESVLKEFQIKSCVNEVIKWRIDKENLPTAISIKCDECEDDNLFGTIRDANSPVNFLITLTLDQLNFHTLEVPIIVEDENDRLQISVLTIQMEKVEVRLTCHPSHVILPPVPLCTRVEIGLHLTINSVERGFQVKNIGFVTWDGKCSKECPFSVVFSQGKAFRSNPDSQELVVQLQIESSHFFAISNRPQPPCLLFIAESLGDGVKLILHVCVPFVFATDDSYFSTVHFNSLPNASGERLMAYQWQLESRASHVLERWLRHYGFPGGIHGLNFPTDFQCCLSLHYIRLQEQRQKNDEVVHSQGVLAECLAHMAGSWSLHGVPRSLTLPIGDTTTCIGALYNHHAALVCFAESQGGCVGHIAPEHLMTYADYLCWIRNGRPCGYDDHFNVDISNMPTLDGVSTTPTVILSNPDGKVSLRYPVPSILDKEAFERASRMAWTDLFLQLLKTLEFGEETEAKLLPWINGSIAHGWTKLCEANTQSDAATWIHLPSPKVNNFPEDLASGLALAAIIASQAPFMAAEVLSEMSLDPKSPQLLFHNAVQVVKALELMRLDVDLTPADIFHPNVIHMTLVLSRLYRLLPEYRIQSTISFAGNLQTRALKHLNLINPTNQLLRYQCFFIGGEAKCFRLEAAKSDMQVTELELAPNGASTLTLSFTVRALHHSAACLLLVPQRGRTPRGSTMVFRLIGEATGLKCEEVFEFKTICYRAVVGSISIQNPFKVAGHFKIRLVESALHNSGMSRGCLRGFTCRLPEMFLHAARATNVEIAFHPFSVGEYKAQLVLSNHDLGDFAVELRGYSTASKAISSGNNDEIFKICCPVGTEHYVNLQLPSKNLMRDSAMEWVARYCLPPLELKRIEISGALCDVVSKLLNFNDLDPPDTVSRSMECDFCKAREIQRRTRFQINCNSSVVELPRVLDVNLEEFKGTSRHVDLPFRTFCPQPGIYHISILLSAADDFRCFTVECKASEDVKTEPYVVACNDGEDVIMERFLADPTIFITEDLEKLHRLAGRGDPSSCLYAGRIEIKCQVGGCTHKVNQRDEHDVLLFLPKNKSSRTHSFRVESDFPTDILVYDAKVIARPNCRGRCRIVVPIKRRAHTFGRLQFREDSMDKRQPDEPEEISLLYEVDIRIKPAPPIQHLEVTCHCLEVNQIAIPLNFSTLLPTDDQLLRVTLEGSDLTGPNFAEGVSIYAAEYRPTCLGVVRASAIFYNPNFGEVWIDLTLVTQPPLPRLASPWRCELGRKYVGVVKIANPSRESYHLLVEVVNGAVFTIESYSLQKERAVIPLVGNNVFLPASSILYLNVTFQPQEYGHYLNDGEIVLKEEKIGELRVKLRGEGCLPKWNSEVCITSEAGKSQLFNVFFTNPFPYPIDIHCALESVDSTINEEVERAFNAFEIRGERRLTLQGKQRMEFHLEFSPSSMHFYRAQFKVIARKVNIQDGGRWDTELAWSTPLRGTPILRGSLELSPKDLLHEAVHHRKQPKPIQPPLLKGEAGISTLFKLHLNLAGFVKGSDEDMFFNWRFLVDSCHKDNLVDASTVIKKAIVMEQTKCDFVNPFNNVPHLELSGVFRPTRSFEIDATLCVTSKAGGMWVFPIRLEATLTRKVERRLVFSPQGLYKSDTKTLRLDSREEVPAKFKAFLVKSGAGGFSINKTSGLLPAKESGFYTLILKFTRRRYDREAKEQLVLQTPTMEWMYELSAEALS